MNFDHITTDNWLMYATKTYDNPQCHSVEEFNEDLRRFSSVKRLLLRLSRNDKNVNIRMILNHIIIINNIFGNNPSAKLLFCYCEPATHPYLKSFLLFLNILPQTLKNVNIESIEASQYVIDKLTDI